MRQDGLMRAVDAHLHLWDPSRLSYPWLSGPLAQRLGPEELLTTLPPGDERGFVFVEAACEPHQNIDEVAWVSELAETLPIRAIVAGIRLNRGAETLRELDLLAEYPLVRGVRHVLQGEDAGTAQSAEFIVGARAVAARGWTFDACVKGAAQLRDVAALAAAVPELPIVLDHLGKPDVGSVDAPLMPDAEWLDAIAQLAQHPQVFCKVSGLPAEATGAWTAEQLAPFLDAVADAFGIQRLIYGSDWPVSAVTESVIDPAGAEKWAACVQRWGDTRGPQADAIGGHNSERFYLFD